MDDPRPPRYVGWVLILFGAGIAPLLGVLGLFGLNDVRAVAESRLMLDVASEARSVQGRWELRMQRPSAVAASDFELEFTDAKLTLPAPAYREITEAASLHLLAARADLASGQGSSGLEHLQDALAADANAAAGVLMALVHGHRLRADEVEARLDLRSIYTSWAQRIPHDAAVEGISARLLGLLSAGSWLEPGALAAELEAFSQALRAGQAAMPRPAGDRAVWSSGGLALEHDPFWQAIIDMAKRRLTPTLGGVDSIDWDHLFAADLRLVSAVRSGWPKAVFASASADGWALTKLGGDRWISSRRSPEGGWKLHGHDAADLDAALQSLVEGDEGYAAIAFGADSEASSLVEPLTLAGVPERLTLTHSDTAALLRPLTLRLRLLRFGLVGVALLMAGACLLAWIAMRREARVRALRSTFVASVSHDLRTPVAAIGLLAENMAHGYHLGSEASYVESLQGETARLRRLIDDLLDFGRMERGLPPQVRRSPVAVEGWIETFVERERVRCHDFGCSLDVVTVNLPRDARLDVHAMERALANLIDNALKHGRPEAIELRVSGLAETLEFQVIDAGSGLGAAALRADLFKPFERGAAKSAGTGLGLSIVRAIAEGHGGTASLRAGSPGAVATVTVALREGGSAA